MRHHDKITLVEALRRNGQTGTADAVHVMGDDEFEAFKRDILFRFAAVGVMRRTHAS